MYKYAKHYIYENISNGITKYNDITIIDVIFDDNLVFISFVIKNNSTKIGFYKEIFLKYCKRKRNELIKDILA